MKYNNVTSKVKRYIEDIKEQNKKSAQKKSTEIMNVMHKPIPSLPKGGEQLS